MEQSIEDIIRQTIKQCFREYTKQSSDDNSTVIYNDTSELLVAYYKAGEKDAAVTYAIQAQRFDPYFRIIPMYYKDGQTLDTIASIMGVDISTIVRNKKRLCMEVYKNII